MSLDLFTPVVPYERFHPAFARVYADADEHDKAVLKQWSEGFVDRDGKFVKEFQTTFDSSFWELYLNAAFNELGFQCDFQKSRPDFCVVTPEPFSVEATVALNAQGSPSVTDTNPSEFPQDFNEFNRQAVIRLSNSFHAKRKKYVESYSSLPHVTGKPFALALAPFDRPHFYLQTQRAVEALLYRAYVDEEKFIKQPPGSNVQLVAEDLPYVEKDSGGRLPLGMFCDESMQEISAVIQSTTGTWSKVRVMGGDPDVVVTALFENRAEGGQIVFKGPNQFYSENILDGLRVYHNPFARYPLGYALFDRPEIFQATCRSPARLVNLSDSRKLLANRTVMTMRPVGFMKRS